ncbi:nucleoside diphosphatase [Purpureocillium lavendulum]|uniref:Nucleoside diphosphatase n=1 Tax=Purpureocillium lavendulum TaxID=1247861 RepID=A0AB34FVY1_9HYPO|nr:nucleoside diphosphatase [Purpureocillium lavendulum]
MTEAATAQTPPVLHGPSDKERKYDRQLRLWAASGQAALESANILLVNSGSGTVGAETLKNLVLPGIGRFTIIDAATVDDADLGVNFFLDDSCLGKSRAECCARLLQELNPEVVGDWHPKTKDPLTLEAVLEGADVFTMVMYTLPLPPDQVDAIRAYAQKHSAPLVAIHSVGFYSYFKFDMPYTFPIVDTHPDDTATTDLRLLSPWPELSAFAGGMTQNIDSLDDHAHGHLPLVVILLHYLDLWKETHDGSYPTTYADKVAFRDLIGGAMRRNNAEGAEENFEEAISAVMKHVTPSSLPSSLQQVFEFSHDRKHGTKSSFWILAEAVQEFYRRHQQLPVPGGLPDMKAESNVYIKLQNLYKAKARQDASEVLAIAQSISGGPEIDPAEAELFCVNAKFIKLINARQGDDLTIQRVAEEQLANDKIAAMAGPEVPTSLIHIYVALTATSHAASLSADDIVSSMTHRAPALKGSEKAAQIASEVSRARGELHNISAVTGGMVAQEVIKIVTQQYIPIDNTHVFCIECAHDLSIAKHDAPHGTVCPACNAQLSKPDDAVLANLNPSEDYKTSVLSGLSPNIVMECAGRALSFWAYQTTQEIYYQQYLYKTLTEKYSNLNLKLEQTVGEANAEIERLQNKVNACEADSEMMRRKNDELAQAYKDKSRKLLQTQELYDRVKRKVEMVVLIPRPVRELPQRDPRIRQATSPISNAYEYFLVDVFERQYSPLRQRRLSPYPVSVDPAAQSSGTLNPSPPRANIVIGAADGARPRASVRVPMGKHSRYGVILDAGSSGTRVYVYKWKHPAAAAKHASTTELHSLPKLKLKESKKIHPGVSTFAQDVASVGPDHLQSLVDVALKEVPAAQVPETPLFLMATAGVRFLPKHQQADLLQGMCAYFRENTKFDLPDCNSHIQVISGETEGLYGWLAANYLLGGFDHPDQHAHGKGHHTYGFLDMGGASAQIAFAPNATEAARHANDLKLVRMRRVDGSSVEHRVFTATWLGFGANKARIRYVDTLKDNYAESAQEIPDPCMPRGLRTTFDGEPVTGTVTHKAVLVGTGAFEECLRKTHPLLRKDAPCDDHPCLLNGQHVPAIDFDVNHFVGVSEYWHTTHGVFGKENKAYDLSTYQHAVMDYCSRDWTAIESELDKRKKTPQQKTRDAQEACFKASWLINVLHEGIGIPRLSMEQMPSPGINATKEAAEKAKAKGFLNPFQPVDKIDGIEVSWTLGKMVLYAAGQIPDKNSAPLPVGFGSNVESGTPPDFEHAGSVPLLPVSNSDGDDDDLTMTPSKSTFSIMMFLIFLLVVAYVLRKPDRRRRLLGVIRRRRRSGSGRKPARGALSLAGKLFGRNTMAYERVMEEGEAAEFELGGIDSDDHEYSDSSEGSRSGKSHGLATPRLNVDRFEAQPASVMDRNGLVLRTESRERLAPSLQMLNAGRRSRAGSPTRLKSPLTTPADD